MSFGSLDPRLGVVLITPPAGDFEAWLPTAELALASGIRAIQLREKRAPAAELYRQALVLRELTRQYGALLLINGRVDAAAACKADGVHLGASELPAVAARKLLGPGVTIGYSAHAGEGPGRWQGANFVTFSPVFSSPGKGQPLGAVRLAQFVAGCQVPVVALGGITCENAASAMRAGAAGVAVIREIFDAPSPAGAARRLVALVQENLHGTESGA